MSKETIALRRKAEADYDKVDALFQKPNTMDVICSHVSNGGAITELCTLMDLDYGALMNYINARPNLYTRLNTAHNDRTEWTIEKIINELRKIALSDVRQLFTSTGQLLPPNEWPEEIAKCVQSVETVEMFDEKIHVGDTKKVKFWDKTKAIELLGKNLNLFMERYQVEQKITLESLVSGSITEVEYEKK
jgi:hypothetical protein